MTPQAHLEVKDRFLMNPYQDFYDDRTDAASQLEKNSLNPKYAMLAASQGSANNLVLKREESGFLAGSSIDVLEVLNQQPDYTQGNLERKNAFKKGDPSLKSQIDVESNMQKNSNNPANKQQKQD